MGSASNLPSHNGLAFDEDTHVYSVPSKGLILPSVTTIMRFMANDVYGAISSATLDAAANRGARVHGQTELLDLYGYLETDSDTELYLYAYQEFLSNCQPEWLGVEWRGYHESLRYAGTIDRIGYVTPDDGTGVDVLDIKTTSIFHQAMVGAQTGAYAAILKSYGVAVRGLYGLQLYKDGRYRLYKLSDGYKTFLHCLGLHNALSV